MSGKNIAQTSEKDKVWNIHKTENAEIGRLYGQNPRYFKYSQRMSECADWLEFAEVKEHDHKLKLTRASFCHVRHCPVCQWRKSLARIARFMSNLPGYLEDFPDYAYIFATFTSRNCDFDAIRETIKTQNDALKKLLKRKELKGVVHGYVRVNEVTKGQDGLAHPHIHVILAVPKSYFSGRYYISQKRWAELWGEVMGLDYEPRVDVRRVKMSERKKAKLREQGVEPTSADDLVSGLLEVSKYSIKPADVVDDADFLYAVTAQCFHLRFIATGGCLKDIFQDGAKGAEEISDEEMLRPGDEENEEKASSWRQLYLWQRERQGYLLRLRRKAASDPLQDNLEFREALTEAIRDREAERERGLRPPRPQRQEPSGGSARRLPSAGAPPPAPLLAERKSSPSPSALGAGPQL